MRCALSEGPAGSGQAVSLVGVSANRVRSPSTRGRVDSPGLAGVRLPDADSEATEEREDWDDHPSLAKAKHAVWCGDLVHDSTRMRHPMRILTLKDDGTCWSWAMEVDSSLSHQRGIAGLKRLVVLSAPSVLSE